MLTIPLSIVANFVTPVLRNKLSTVTESSLHRRIAKLEAEFARLEKDCPPITVTEERILEGIICIAKLVSFAIYTLGIMALIVAGLDKSPAIGSNLRVFFYVIFGMCYLLPWMWRKTIDKLVKYRSDHSETRRKALQKSINELKAIAANW